MSIVISGGGGGGGGATTLNGLSDVNISGVANGQIIAYNNTSGNWENRTGISGGLTYKGSFNATTGAPSIANAVQGDFYVISVGGTIYGQTWVVGDHLLINADMSGVIDNAKIDKIDNTDQVTSVNGSTGAVTGLLEAANNLSDLSNVPTARTNLGLGTAATSASSDFLAVANNLSDLGDAATARTNLGLGTAATSAATDFLAAANNLSDVANAGTARTNLGLGSVAVANDTDGVTEGASNLYFTNARADARISAAGLLVAANNLSDIANAGTARTNLGLGSAAVANDTDGVTEGASNLYFTNARADARITAAGLLAAANNLSDVANAGTARTNLGLGTAATSAASDFLAAANNLSDVANAGTARTNLGLGTAATSAATDFLAVANNLSDLGDAATARTNLGLGTAATAAATDFLGDVVDDTSPQLGGDLDVQARIITTSTVNQSIGLEPDGTGTVVARGTGAGLTPGTVTLNCEQNTHGVALQSPPHSSGASYTLKLPTGVGTNGQTLTTDGNNPAQLSWTTAAGGTRPVVYSVNADTTIGTDTAIASSELERVYIVDSSAALRTMTLPQITGNVGNGYRLNIKRDGGNNVDITPNANDNIDGGTDGVAVSLTVDKAAFTLICDGTNWHII